MSADVWHLVLSAASLDAVCDLVKARWYWSVCEAVPTDDPKVWQVRSGNGISSGTRIRQAGKRYRFESR